MNKTQPSTPSNCKISYQHRSNEKSQGDDVSSKTPTAKEGEKIINNLWKIDSSCWVVQRVYASGRSITGTVASTRCRIACDAAISLHTVEYAATFCRKFTNAARCGSSGAYICFQQPVEDEDDMATTSCAAHQLCCNPNSDTDNYRFCMNCNGEAHTICTEQINFQMPASDKLVMASWGKSATRKLPNLIMRMLYFVFCVRHKWSRRNSIQPRRLALHTKLRRESLDHQLGCCVIYVRLQHIIVRQSFSLLWTRLKRKLNRQRLMRHFISKNVIGACLS